jgi:hypothetical protein
MTAPIGAGGEHDSGNSQFDRRQGVQSRFVEESLASRQAGTAKPASNRDNVRASAKVAQTAGRSRRIMVPVVNKTGKRLGEVPQSTTSAGAGKIARGEVVFSRRFGYYAWVKE